MLSTMKLCGAAAWRSGAAAHAQAYRSKSTAQMAAALSAAKATNPKAHFTFTDEGTHMYTTDPNPGCDLDLGWVNSVNLNHNAVLRRAGEIGARRSIKKQHQAAWLLRAVTNIDLTTLAGDDTPGNVARLCSKAKNPIRRDILEKLGAQDLNLTTGAVCVYPRRVKDAVKHLAFSGVAVAAVATGFPSGQIPLPLKCEEIRSAVADGASEIDIVIPRDYAIRGEWGPLYEELQQFKEACGPAHSKAILAVGELPSLRHVYQASLVSMAAGMTFIKTSTGKESTNASLPVTLVMARAIRDFKERTGIDVGYKPAGGISAAKTVLAYQALLRDELGVEYLHNHMFRIGASSLLLDVERQLYHQAYGKYANIEHFALS